MKKRWKLSPLLLALAVLFAGCSRDETGSGISSRAKLIVAENPTQGLDISAMEEVWRRILAVREHAGILLVTSDLTEAMTLADTFAVMYGGRFIDVFPRTDTAKVEAIGLMLAGIKPGEKLDNKEAEA